MVCAVCSQPLNQRLPMNALGQFTGESVYEHTRAGAHDHDPVPQPRAEHFEEELTMFCDFCTSTDVKWSYTAVPIQGYVLDVDDGPVHNARADADWAACELCARLVDRRSKRALLNRAMSAGIPLDAREIVAGLHEAFFANLKPGRRRIKRRKE